MHPFGGTPICPRCNKAVYLAEQIMGPGRKLYHKPCLSCTICGKRLDSYSLVEHDQEPYCKTCHVKHFGTRDLRNANLPDRDDVLLSPPTSPTSPNRHAMNLPPLPPRSTPSPARAASATATNSGAPALPVRRTMTGGGPFDRSSGGVSPPPILRPTRALSPVRAATSIPPRVEASQETDWDAEPVSAITHTPEPYTPTHTGRSARGLPRTVPLRINSVSPSKQNLPIGRSTYATSSSPPSSFNSNDAVNRSGLGRIAVPLVPTNTGTRYGAALGSGKLAPMPTGNRQWGGGTPICGKCGKTVYFAEQVKAIGKTFHKGCLRCTECNTSLDSTRLTENEGAPFCHRCYSKLYGPQGSGYALLGKAGG